jgi:hypothetical protein
VPSDQELLKILYSQIENGNARVVLINDGLKAAHKQNVPIEKNDKNLSEKFDFIDFAKRQANYLKKVFTKMVHADYPILEKVFHYDENSTGAVPAIIDPSSVREHSTGWKSWDDPFEIGTLGIFKALAAYNVSKFLKLSDDIMMIALVGSQTELISAQYLVTGKSVILKKWYGSYSVRYNIRTLSFEIPWVRFKGCSQEERFIVELKRKDRLMFHKNRIYNHPEVLIPPFIPMEQFLSDYQKIFTPPEHDVNKPIQIT